MKAYLRSLVLIISLLASPSLVHAQFIKKLKKAVQEGAENAVERRVSKEVENASERKMEELMEGVFGESSDYEGSGIDYGEMMGSMNFDVDTEDQYQFKGYTDMEVTGTDEKGKAIDPSTIRFLHSNNQDHWAMKMDNPEKKEGQVSMVFDHKNHATILFMENEKNEKSSMAYGMDWNKMIENSSKNNMEKMEEEEFNFDKTGNTKNILGHECEEYRGENEDGTFTFWASKEAIPGFTSFFSNSNFFNSQAMRNKYPKVYNKLPEGNILETSYSSKIDKSTSIMKTLEINNSEDFDFKMAEYPNVMQAQ
ncbi:hypothetical protein KZP23_12290 [Echinicola marina]|uniref:hypothetical protein n=1 Tax=Echinicola marina TaxID=2859768 RepID=UPI001CF60C1C|nr:hypothetical protein [Echinicola marina]UCS91537.1 hypothetical protein KZP23_12290 [Echinicola marina]